MRLLSIITALFSLLVIACSGSSSSQSPLLYTISDPGGTPDGVTVTAAGGVYITDIGTGEIKTVDSDGTATTITYLDDAVGATTHPDGITSTIAPDGTVTLYVADTGSSDPEGGTFSTDGSIIKIDIAADGTATPNPEFVDSTTLQSPSGIAADPAGNLYVADQATGDVFKIPVTSGNAGTPISLTGGSSVDVEQPHGLTLVANDDGSITLYSTDQG